VRELGLLTAKPVLYVANIAEGDLPDGDPVYTEAVRRVADKEGAEVVILAGEGPMFSSGMDLGSLAMPLGGSNGTTNSVMFGVALGALRAPDMTVTRARGAPKMVHHDMTAPPFWNVRKKATLYCDGFSPKNHRVLIQFLLIPSNDAETVKGWEDDFRDILAWIESLEPPKYPWSIDEPLAARGKAVFNRHCSRCHGTYDEGGRYDQKVIPIEEVGTDPVRLRALTREHRRWLQLSWMSYGGRDPVELEPQGYVAPPLDGIWATAPYLLNGSVPTLWHLFHPDERPVVWKRTEDGYDREKIGLEITPFDDLPGWDSVMLLKVLGAVERATGRQAPMLAVLEATDLRGVHAALAA
jgi:acyl carrier protein